MKELSFKKPLFQATLGDLVEVLKEEFGFSNENVMDGGKVPSSEKRYVRGMKELADTLHCSLSTAQRIKSSGVLDPAISQIGKVMLVDAEQALELLKVSNKKWGRKYSK